MSHRYETYLSAARRAADRAADVIREGYSGGFSVRTKADATPVTDVDEHAEQVIRETLAEAWPDHDIYGEEHGRSGDASEFLWLVDPIDGTKAFVRGYPFFSTQIALMHCDELVLGVSSAPLYGEVAWAHQDGGAWLNGEPIRVSDVGALEQAALSLGNVHSLAEDARWANLGRIVARCGRIRGYGDFLHYHLLAAGRIDGVIESDVNILDIAALSVIVTEAGGVFTDIDGGRLRLDTRSVMAANPEIYERLSGLLNPAGHGGD